MNQTNMPDDRDQEGKPEARPALTNGAVRPSASYIFPTSDGMRNQVTGETRM